MSDIMKNGIFDWKVFKDETIPIVVHCKTEEEAIDFCKQMDEHGMKWCTKKSYLDKNNWNDYREETCYSNNGRFYHLDYYEKSNYHILEFSDYFKIKKIIETKQEGENKMNSIIVNMENLTVEEREQLLALVKKSNKPKVKVWKPKKDEEYYFIGNCNDIRQDIWDKYNVYGEGRYSIGNCFKTIEEARFAIEKLKVIAELKRFAQEHNEYEIDWTNNSWKYYLSYNHLSIKSIVIISTITVQGANIYFTSEEIAKKAIESIGKDRLKKYYFEVED